MSVYSMSGASLMRRILVLVMLAFALADPDSSLAIGTPVPGYAGWTYSNSGGSTWYYYNNWGRFSYNDSSGVWYNYDKFGQKWRILSAGGTSAAYIFDGALHDLGNGWRYVYSSPAESGNWVKGNAGRFGYNYSLGKWFEADPYVGGWKTLSATGRSSFFVGCGVLTVLGNGWGFIFDYTNDTGLWAKSGTGRFAFGYSTGKWYEIDPYGGGWKTLSAPKRSSAFVGDEQWHDIGNSWTFSYLFDDDYGQWQDNGAMRFRYNYGSGQWDDWLPSVIEWSKLGDEGLSSAFIGDHNYHTVFSDGTRYTYDGQYGSWDSGNGPDFRYDYVHSLWLRSVDADWALTTYEKVVYTGRHYYVGVDYVYYDLSGQSTTVPPNEDFGRGKDAYNEAWNMAVGQKVLDYWIYRPQSDMVWSGGALNVVFDNTFKANMPENKDFNVCWGEYTAQDAIVLNYDLFNTGLSLVVDAIAKIKDIYGKPIDTVVFNSHGNDTGCAIGSWIGTSTYQSYMADFYRWGAYMAIDGQIQLNTCSTGKASNMLNAIASWTGADIFAHDHNVDVWWDIVNPVPPYIQPDNRIWNFNYQRCYYLLDGVRHTYFEYRSDPSKAPHDAMYTYIPYGPKPW